MIDERAMPRRFGRPVGGIVIAAMLLLMPAVPATAQEAAESHVATSPVGEVGQRKTKEQGVIGIEPLARIDSRIQGRIQSRIRNRIDRNYDPEANAVSLSTNTSDQVRNSGKPRGH